MEQVPVTTRRRGRPRLAEHLRKKRKTVGVPMRPSDKARLDQLARRLDTTSAGLLRNLALALIQGAKDDRPAPAALIGGE